jgi:hypothetical protein
MFYEMLTSLATSLKLQRRLVVIIKHMECGLYHDKHQKTHRLFVLDIGQTVTQLVHKEYQFPKIHLFWPPVCGYHDVFHHLSHFFPMISSSFALYVIECQPFIPFWMKFIHHHLFLSIMS